MLTNTLWETTKKWNQEENSAISFFCSQRCCGGFHSFSLTFCPGRAFLCSTPGVWFINQSSHEVCTPVESFKEQEETEMCKVVVTVCRRKGATNWQKSHFRWGVMRAALGRARGLSRSPCLSLSIRLNRPGQNQFCSDHFEDTNSFFPVLAEDVTAVIARLAFKHWRHFNH